MFKYFLLHNEYFQDQRRHLNFKQRNGRFNISALVPTFKELFACCPTLLPLLWSVHDSICRRQRKSQYTYIYVGERIEEGEVAEAVLSASDARCLAGSCPSGVPRVFETEIMLSERRNQEEQEGWNCQDKAYPSNNIGFTFCQIKRTCN